MKALCTIAVIVMFALSICGCRDDCVPDCGQQTCGLDPECGELCGSCQPGTYCVEKNCVSACVVADMIFYAAVDQACAQYGGTCCACYCWNQNRLDFDPDAYIATGACNCLPLMQIPCEGDQLTWAQACVEDEAACFASFHDLIHGTQGLCTLTPL